MTIAELTTNSTEIAVRQHASLPKQREVDRAACWIVVLPVPAAGKRPPAVPYAELMLGRRDPGHGEQADSEPQQLDLPNSSGTRVALACIDGAISAFDLLTLARKLVAVALRRSADQLPVTIGGFPGKQRQRIAEAIVAAVFAAVAVMPDFRQKQEHRKQPAQLDIYGLRIGHGYKRTRAEADGNALARYLSMLPPNKLTPAAYLKHVQKLARREGWRLDFYDQQALRQRKAGAFLAVCQASPANDAGILRLRYRPKGRQRRQCKKVILVGKGICYDTGGANLKPAKFMYGMHEDMQGSAVALGALLALTRLNSAYEVEAWLALAVNHIGPRAYVPNDVVVAADGTSIEIVHTDAEGRMVLADTLVLAAKEKPDLLLDFATLTGACMYSLDSSYSGVFTNRDKFNNLLIRAGRDSGERVWPFPMDRDYDEALESKIADVKQCTTEGHADHIRAARFLQRFVQDDIPWIHVDLASSNHKGGLAHIPTDTTGFGIRITMNLLLDKNIL